MKSRPASPVEAGHAWMPTRRLAKDLSAPRALPSPFWEEAAGRFKILAIRLLRRPALTKIVENDGSIALQLDGARRRDVVLSCALGAASRATRFR